ncbi:MAG: SgcJ/EcaC family oxidoreductase [Gemmataceae bacterium]|nr:SgcJ/EcaC family oxidoreductase [Gemmataceae bacterium]
MIVLLLLLSADKPDAAKEVRAMIEAQEAAWNKGDLDGFLKPYWDDDRLTFYSGDAVSKGLAKVRERYEKNYKAEGKEMGKLSFSDLSLAALSADHVVALGRWKVVKKKETAQGLFTLIVRKTPDGWRIVHDHTSAKAK